MLPYDRSINLPNMLVDRHGLKTDCQLKTDPVLVESVICKLLNIVLQERGARMFIKTIW